MVQNNKTASPRVPARAEEADSINREQYTPSDLYGQEHSPPVCRNAANRDGKFSFNGCPSDNSAASQRSRLLKHLQEIGPVTTLQCRHLLDCMHPGMRICELRKSGHPIETVWVDDLTPEGNSHRVARYILRKTRQLSLLDIHGNSARQEG